DVLLVESALGLVEGAVLDGTGTKTVPGVPVTLRVGDGVTPARTVTTDPAGRFAFPGTPAGSLDLRAENPQTPERGSASAVLADGAGRIAVAVRSAPTPSVPFLVLEPNGLTPADATVSLQGTGAGPADFLQGADTDASGRVRFDGVPLGTYVVTARSRTAGET